MDKYNNSKVMAKLLKFRKRCIYILEFIIFLSLLLTIIKFNIFSLGTLLFSMISMVYLLIDKNRLFKIKK